MNVEILDLAGGLESPGLGRTKGEITFSDDCLMVKLNVTLPQVLILNGDQHQ